MAKKDKVVLNRSEDFASIEDELSAALDKLEQANTSVLDLLAREAPPAPEPAGDAAAEPAAEGGGVPQAVPEQA